ncbi:hypothetical protein HY490_00935 [Candidatus Woesearchaeota archaeon]|nr:hypothetical protein [Candidatus Woesearchaeota archaeon]
MEKYLQGLLSIVNKNFNTKISLKPLVPLTLFSNKSRNDFERFLIQSRIIPLLQMRIIFTFGMRSSCAFGYEQYHHYIYARENDVTGEPLYAVKDFGVSIVDKKYSAKEVFNCLLYRLGISTVAVQSPQDLVVKHVNAQGQIPALPPDCSSHDGSENEMLILLDLPCVLSYDKVFVSTQYVDGVQRLLDQYRQIFSEFLDAHKNSVTIPHDIYIDWLLQWFPGMVHIRSLPARP